jgi:hypothetical protein
MLDEATLDISGTFAGEAIRFLTLYYLSRSTRKRSRGQARAYGLVRSMWSPE